MLVIRCYSTDVGEFNYFSSIRSVLICWMDMYPEDFYCVETGFAMLTNLLDFGQKHKMADVRAKARKLREKFKHIAAQGGMIGG